VVAGINELRNRALAHYEAGEYRHSRAAALEGLARDPDDPQLLRLAATSSMELEVDDAADHFRKLADLQPGDALAWQGLGDALLSRGRVADATAAFRRAVELRPDDVATLIDLGHALHAAGQTEEAVSFLTRAVEREPDNLAVLRSLVEIQRHADHAVKALGVARRLLERRPDVIATLDVADLSLDLDRLDQATDAYERLRRIDAEPGHEIYALYGLIAIEIRRRDWRRAVGLAVKAARVDRNRRTTDLLAFVTAQLFGARDRPAPSLEEIDRSLAASRAEHRLLHVEPLSF